MVCCTTPTFVTGFDVTSPYQVLGMNGKPIDGFGFQISASNEVVNFDTGYLNPFQKRLRKGVLDGGDLYDNVVLHCYKHGLCCYGVPFRECPRIQPVWILPLEDLGLYESADMSTSGTCRLPLI